MLNVQRQAADKLIARDPERAAAIALCRSEAQAALSEVRRSVAAMRRAPLDGQALPEAIAALVRDFNAASPLDVQEGLTNTQKHAAAATVRVVLIYGAVEVRVQVCDDGQGALAVSSSAGFGLIGLRERVERLHGTFSAGLGPDGGFVLAVALPV